jgi:hypothetical protein
MAQYFTLRNDDIRRNAINAIMAAEDGSRLTIAPAQRSNDQNAKMWAMLADVARAQPEGRNWTPETWKAAFMHYLGHQVMFADGLDGSGPFPVGFRTSRLTVGQMSDLITVIYQYGDEHGVEWTETIYGGFIQERAA